MRLSHNKTVNNSILIIITVLNFSESYFSGELSLCIRKKFSKYNLIYVIFANVPIFNDRKNLNIYFIIHKKYFLLKIWKGSQLLRIIFSFNYNVNYKINYNVNVMYT